MPVHRSFIRVHYYRIFETASNIYDSLSSRYMATIYKKWIAQARWRYITQQFDSKSHQVARSTCHAIILIPAQDVTLLRKRLHMMETALNNLVTKSTYCAYFGVGSGIPRTCVPLTNSSNFGIFSDSYFHSRVDETIETETYRYGTAIAAPLRFHLVWKVVFLLKMKKNANDIWKRRVIFVSLWEG